METDFIGITPVLPSQDIERDIQWYTAQLGFQLLHADSMYAVLKRENLYIHLQWHADTEEDPLLGGSVIKVFVKNLSPLFEELLERGAVQQDRLRENTPWNTNEVGLYDLNKNAIFFVEDL